MSDELKNFEKLQKDSEKLINTLDNLYSEVSSYKTAKDELTKANEGLLSFLSLTKELVKESHDTVLEINKLLNSQLIEKIENINLSVVEEMQKKFSDIECIINEKVVAHLEKGIPSKFEDLKKSNKVEIDNMIDLISKNFNEHFTSLEHKLQEKTDRMEKNEKILKILSSITIAMGIILLIVYFIK